MKKITDAEFKCKAQIKKRKNMMLGAYDELEKILPDGFQQMHSLFIYFNVYFFICCIKAYTSCGRQSIVACRAVTVR
jgi:hypothetical protein